MFQTKKKKIENYLAGRKVEEWTAFDQVLSDYLNGELKRNLEALGIRKIEIHIDWLPEYKCIGIQGVAHGYWNIQIDPTEFLISIDKDEPDDDHFYSLESKEQFYETLEKAVKIDKFGI